MPACGRTALEEPLGDVRSAEEEFVEFADAASLQLRRTAFLLCGNWHAKSVTCPSNPLARPRDRSLCLTHRSATPNVRRTASATRNDPKLHTHMRGNSSAAHHCETADQAPVHYSRETLASVSTVAGIQGHHTP